MKKFVTLEELLRQEAARSSSSFKIEQPPLLDLGQLADVELPEELLELLAEKNRLEQQLRALTGQGNDSTGDMRQALCFPVKVHTKESRIEERRLKRRDEQLRIIQRKTQEARAQAERRLRAELEAKAQAKQRVLIRQRLHSRIEERRQMLAAALKQRRKSEERMRLRLDDRLRRAAVNRIVEERDRRQLEERRLVELRSVLESRALERAASDLEWSAKTDRKNALAAARTRDRNEENGRTDQRLENRRLAALERARDRRRRERLDDALERRSGQQSSRRRKAALENREEQRRQRLREHAHQKTVQRIREEQRLDSRGRRHSGRAHSR